MDHIIAETDDIPFAPQLMDRRKGPDRRAEWRGGRRDQDWLARPAGALARLEEARQRPIHRVGVLSPLNLW